MLVEPYFITLEKTTRTVETAKVVPSQDLDSTFLAKPLVQSSSRIPNKKPTSWFHEVQPLVVGFLNSNSFTLWMTILTIYALFGDDVNTLGFGAEADVYFDSLFLVCFLFFVIELVLSCVFVHGYLNSFYFWLDLLATLSLIPDIGFIWYSMLGTADTSSEGTGSSQIKSAGAVSSGSKRTTQIVRVVRLIRIIRLVKLYKNAQKTIAMREAKKLKDAGVASLVPLESRVGKRLSDLTIKRVIILVLSLLIFLPLLDYSFYYTGPTSFDYGAKMIQEFRGTAGFTTVYDRYLSFHNRTSIRPVFYLSYQYLGKAFTWESSNPDEHRNVEIHVSDETYVAAFADMIIDSKLDSAFNIAITVFAGIVLTLGAIYFTSDANNLVIAPIEKMITTVQTIAANPMKAKAVTKKEDIYAILAKQPKGCWSKLCEAKPDKTEYETTLIENTIMKIGVLLALGFGEAGSVIIGSNLAKPGDIDLMLQGSRVMAIFGFCDIRNFTDSTEILQQKVMVFVNEIGRIVHSIVDKHQGAANKNIGDAFLLVWKFEEADLIRTENDVEIDPASVKAKHLAELSLLSFMKICAKINRYPECLKYRRHEGLNARMPNYSVKMGFGLHVGWAIEGAIGSEFKIDASYLSPNVNMASRLEAATKQYGVPLLISGSLYRMLTEPVQEYCRHIDTVTVKGSNHPVEMFTADMNFDALTPKVKMSRRDSYFNTREELRTRLNTHQVKPIDLFERSKDIKNMRKGFQPEFYVAFRAAAEAYIEGRWGECKRYLEASFILQPNDGPSTTLWNIIEETEFEAPVDWPGYRVLTDKCLNTSF